MNDLVGLIRRESEMKTALVELDKLRAREAQVRAAGGRAYNPGWHLALDLRNMLVVAECVAQAALERQESRGGHTRDDYPAMSPEWRKVNLICSLDAERRRDAAAAADGADADRPARAVRRGRAEEVHDRRRTDRAARCRGCGGNLPKPAKRPRGR